MITRSCPSIDEIYDDVPLPALAVGEGDDDPYEWDVDETE